MIVKIISDVILIEQLHDLMTRHLLLVLVLLNTKTDKVESICITFCHILQFLATKIQRIVQNSKYQVQKIREFLLLAPFEIEKKHKVLCSTTCALEPLNFLNLEPPKLHSTSPSPSGEGQGVRLPISCSPAIRQVVRGCGDRHSPQGLFRRGR